MQAPFFLRNFASESVVKLLKQTRFGTNGAKYQHLNTEEIIQQLDDPLFLSLERNEKALANVAFCRRNGDWYIRYFTFASHLHTQKKGIDGAKSTGILKKGIAAFFQEKLENEAKSFYAYVDPQNVKSIWMCENFGFQSIAKLKTQSFSRSSPKLQSSFELLKNETEIKQLLRKFESHLFFVSYQAPRVKFAVIRDNTNEVIAFCKYQKAHWKIDRLPGKFGSISVKLAAYIPILSRIFSPANHHFLVPEAVYAKNNDPIYLTQLFESILASEKHQLLLWWADEREPILCQNQSKMKWGLFHRLLGNPLVEVYAKYTDIDYRQLAQQQLVYVSGMDLL